MRLLFLGLILSLQVFGAGQAGADPAGAVSAEAPGHEVPSQETIHPDVLDLGIDRILDIFPEDSKSAIRASVSEALSKINPVHIKELLKLTVEALHNHNDPISPSFVAGLIAGINAGLNFTAHNSATLEENFQNADRAKNNPQPPSGLIEQHA